LEDGQQPAAAAAPPPPQDVLLNSVQHKKLLKQMENGIGDLLWTESKEEQTKAMNQLN
jgi:hypothetical protein